MYIRMMSRQQIHRMIDEIPETELGMISRLLEGMQATRPLPEPAVVVPQAGLRTAAGHLRPPAPLMPPQNHAPLTSQYSTMLENEATPDNRSLLRRVMFCRVSDLLTWVNTGQEPSSNHQ